MGYPERADLGVAVVRRYTESVLASLGAPDDRTGSAVDRLQWLIRMLRRTLGEDGRMCPCGALAGAATLLPPAVAAGVPRYVDRIGGRTARGLGPGTDSRGPRAEAERGPASTQGAVRRGRRGAHPGPDA